MPDRTLNVKRDDLVKLRKLPHEHAEFLALLNQVWVG